MKLKNIKNRSIGALLLTLCSSVFATLPTSEFLANSLTSSSLSMGNVKVEYSFESVPGDYFIEFNKLINRFNKQGVSEADYIKMNSFAFDYVFITDGFRFKYTQTEAPGFDSENHRNGRQVNFDGSVFGIYEAHILPESGEWVDGLANVKKTYSPHPMILSEFINAIPIQTTLSPDGWIAFEVIAELIGNGIPSNVTVSEVDEGIGLFLSLKGVDGFEYAPDGIYPAVRLVFSKSPPFKLISSESLFISDSDIKGEYIESGLLNRCVYDYGSEVSAVSESTEITNTGEIMIFHYSPKEMAKFEKADDYQTGLDRIVTIKLKNLEFLNKKNIDHLLAIDLPPGTRLLDQVSNEVFKIGGSESNLEALSNEFSK